MRHVAISGELGSGRTSVARRIAESTERKWSVGEDVHRRFAEERGITTVELNLLAEREPKIDAEVDGGWTRLAETEDNFVFDSRLAWHFVEDRLAVQLVVDPTVAASRLFSTRSSIVERYEDPDDAAAGGQTRQASERRRFIDKYGVDIWRLANYHVVVDTTFATVDEIVEVILACLDSNEDIRRLFVGPRNVLATAFPVRELAASADADGFGSSERPELGYSRPFFFVAADHVAVSAAVRAGPSLMEAVLAGEGADTVLRDISAEDYLRQRQSRVGSTTGKTRTPSGSSGIQT